MRGTRVPLVVTALLFAASASAGCQVDQAAGDHEYDGLAGRAQDNQGIEGLAWLAGCWQSASGMTDEQWMRPAAGQMMGMVRRVRDGVVVETERLLIRTVGNELQYVASPSGQESAVFTTSQSEGPDWVFENNDHDFPQRIVYRLTESGMLGAYIEGTVDGTVRRVDFPMRRVPCEVEGVGIGP